MGFGFVNRRMISPRRETDSKGNGRITSVAPGTRAPNRLTTRIIVLGIKLIIPKRTAVFLSVKPKCNPMNAPRKKIWADVGIDPNWARR